jgi:hypothetical protein
VSTYYIDRGYVLRNRKAGKTEAMRRAQQPPGPAVDPNDWKPLGNGGFQHIRHGVDDDEE